MKIRFFNANYKREFKINEEFFNNVKSEFKTGSSIAIFTAIQFLDKIDEISKKLEKIGYKIIKTTPDRCSSQCQILGCDSSWDNLKLPEKVDGFVYIGDGYFHPNALLFAQENREKFIPVLVYNIVQDEIKTIGIDIIEKNLKKRKGNLMKFYMSEKIGVYVSTKWGQEFKNMSLKLKDMYPEKKFYFFIGDNFNESEMDNFSWVDCWINTACPRIGQDDVIRQSKAVVNIRDILK